MNHATHAPRTATRIKRRTIAVLAAGTLLAVPGAAFAASAAVGDECVPSDAWIETIPAVGEPTIRVEVSPAVAGRDEIPEVTEVRSVTEYQRYSWNPKQHGVPTQGPTGGDDRWTDNRENWNGTDPLNQIFQHGTQGTLITDPAEFDENQSYFYWEATTTEQVIVVQPRVPAVPPQDAVYEEQENPDYQPARTVEHPAVTCETTDTPTDTPTETTPTDIPTTPTADPLVDPPAEEPTDPAADTVSAPVAAAPRPVPVVRVNG